MANGEIQHSKYQIAESANDAFVRRPKFGRWKLPSWHWMNERPISVIVTLRGDCRHCPMTAFKLLKEKADIVIPTLGNSECTARPNAVIVGEAIYGSPTAIQAGAGSDARADRIAGSIRTC